MTTAFASSDGWNCSGPRMIQRSAPMRCGIDKHQHQQHQDDAVLHPDGLFESRNGPR